MNPSGGGSTSPLPRFSAYAASKAAVVRFTETLAEELNKLQRSAEIYITHLKPGEIEPTMLEIEECAGAHRPRMLQNNLVLEF